jgi:predicted nucleotidyltransferase
MNLTASITRNDIVAGLTRLEPQFRAAGVTKLAIFGSRARNDHQPQSDLDVLIDVDTDRKFSLLDLVGVAHIIEDSLGVSANIFMLRSLEPQFASSIRADIVGIFE